MFKCNVPKQHWNFMLHKYFILLSCSLMHFRCQKKTAMSSVLLWKFIQNTVFNHVFTLTSTAGPCSSPLMLCWYVLVCVFVIIFSFFCNYLYIVYFTLFYVCKVREICYKQIIKNIKKSILCFSQKK